MTKEEYEAMPFKEHVLNGEVPVYSLTVKQVFFTKDEISDWIANTTMYELDPKALRFIICEPNYAARPFSYKALKDCLPQDTAFLAFASWRLKSAFDEFKAAIEGEKLLFWAPGKYRTTIVLEDGEDE